jgi:hypothetical protein
VGRAIYFTPFKRYSNIDGMVKPDQDKNDVVQAPITGTGNLFPLVSNLSYGPSAMEFCFRMQVLYVCDADKGTIYAYRILLKENVGSMAEKVSIDPKYYKLRLLDPETE